MPSRALVGLGLVIIAAGCGTVTEGDNAATSSSGAQASGASTSSGAASSLGSSSNSSGAGANASSAASSSTSTGGGGTSSTSGGVDVECAGWVFNGSSSPWTLDNNLAPATSQPGTGIALVATGGDPFLSVLSSVDLGTCTMLEVDIALSPATSVSQAQFFWYRTTDGWFSEPTSARFNVNGDGARRTYRVNLAGHSLWNGTSVSVRLDPFDTTGTLTLYAVRLIAPASSSGASSSSSSSSAASSSSSSSSSSGVVPGSWASLDTATACQRFAEGRVVNDPSPFTPGSTMCDPGTLSAAGIADGVRRINLYRAMAGLGPVTDDPGLNSTNQYCAVTTAWNPANQSAHHPTSSSTCYTPEAASGAGQSNLAWGPAHPADGVDQFIIDWGNETTFGHRRWILNPPLQPVGIGFYEGGNQYGSAMCLAVFGMGNSGPSPAWLAFPAPGVVPSEIADWPWTFHSNQVQLAAAQVTVTRLSDSMVMPTTWTIMQGGYGQATALIGRTGWDPVIGQTYRVVVTPTSGGAVSYDLNVVNCP